LSTLTPKIAALRKLLKTFCPFDEESDTTRRRRQIAAQRISYQDLGDATDMAVSGLESDGGDQFFCALLKPAVTIMDLF
jgi:hypothetical protein